jgi:hypothetical protein
MPTIELTDEQADELLDTLQARIDELDETIRREDPVDAIGLLHLRERLQEILHLLEIA